MLLFSGTHPGLLFSILHLRALFVQSSAGSDVAQSCDVICSICNFYTHDLYMTYAYTDSAYRNPGLGGPVGHGSCRWARGADPAPKPAALAWLPAPAVKPLLTRACGLTQMKLILISKTESLISSMGGTRSFEERSLEQFNGTWKPLKGHHVLFLSARSQRQWNPFWLKFPKFTQPERDTQEENCHFKTKD